MKIEYLAELFHNSKNDIVIICNIEDADNLIKRTTEGSMNYGQFTVDKPQRNFVNSRSITFQGKTIVFIDEKDAGKFCSLVSKKQ